MKYSGVLCTTKILQWQLSIRTSARYVLVRLEFVNEEEGKPQSSLLTIIPCYCLKQVALPTHQWHALIDLL